MGHKKNLLVIKREQPLVEARFLERPNRFMVRCRIQHANQTYGKEDTQLDSIVEAHLPDPGRMKELLIPETRIWLEPALNSTRKTRWSAVLTEDPRSGELVSIDSTLPNQLIKKALEHGALPELADWSLIRPEARVGHSRFDFLLASADGRKMALEVKSVTLVQERTGLFPDAVTARGTRHVKELTHLSQQQGWVAGILFVGQRRDIDRIQAAAHIDPTFAQTLFNAKQAGVQIMARRCTITLNEIYLDEAIPVDFTHL